MKPTTACAIGAVAITTIGCSRAEPANRSAAEARAHARDVLDSVYAHAGGREALVAIGTLVVQYDYTQYEYGLEPSDAPVLRMAQVVQARDFVNGRNLYEIHSDQPEELWERVVMKPGEAFQVNLLAGTTERYDAPSADMAQYAETQLRWYVYAPITEADLAGSTMDFVGDTVINGTPHAVISYFRGDDSREVLFIDSESWRLTHRERRAPDPTGGERVIHMAYEDYRLVDGLPMPHIVRISIEGRPATRYDISGVQINALLNEEVFQPPDGS